MMSGKDTNYMRLLNKLIMRKIIPSVKELYQALKQGPFHPRELVTFRVLLEMHSKWL